MFVNVKHALRCTNKLLIDLKKCSLHLQVNADIKKPVHILKQKLLKVAVIGMPNAGKSTFINNLMDRKVCATSSKAHTTRRKSQAIFTEGDSQIIFLDTPGVVSGKEQKRFKLEESFLKDCDSSLQEADVVGVIHDVGNAWEKDRLDIKVVKILERYVNTRSFLVLNKIDILKSKRKLLDITRLITDNCIDGKPMISNIKRKTDAHEMKGWPHFSEVFMISALTGTGLSEVRNYLVREAKPSTWMFPCETWSDQTAENIVVNCVKAKFLDFLPQEIPYNVVPYIELFETNNEGVINTVVLVKCPTERIAKLIAGVSNGRLKQITESVQLDLENTFQNFVRINIVLESKKNDK